MLLPLALAAADLQQLVDDAAAAGKRQLTLPKAVYQVDDTLKFDRLNDFTLDGAGSVVLVTRNVIGIDIQRCRNLKLSNFTLDYDPLPFTQGVVKEVDGNSFLLELHRGYPELPRRERLNFHIFNASDRLWKEGVPDLFGCTVTPEGERRYRVTTRHRLPGFLKAGDLAAADWRGNYGIRIGSSDGFTLEGVTIHTAPGLAIIGRFNTGRHRLHRITIGRGDRLPANATEARLLSTAADGINYAYCESGPEITGCDLSFMGDDSVNLHSVALPVVRQERADAFLTLRTYPKENFPAVVKPGMKLRVLREGDFAILAEAEVAKFEATSLQLPAAEIQKYFQRFDPAKDPRHTLYRITLTQPLAVPAGAFVDIPALSGSGFVIRDSYFHDHRARALRIMACNGVIENNRIERIKQNAITVGAEYGFWREAGWAENVVIRNNRIRNVGTDDRLTSPDSYAPGAISLFIRPEPGHTEVASGNRNITVTDNDIDGCSGAAIVLHAVDGALVSGNKIRNVCSGNIAKAGANYGFRVEGPVVVTASAVNVKLENQP